MKKLFANSEDLFILTHFIKIYFVILSFVFIIPQAGIAQQTPITTIFSEMDTDTSDASIFSESIPLVDIPRKVQETHTWLRRVQLQLRPRAEIRQIEENLPMIADEIKRMEADPATEDFDQLVPRILEDVNNQWSSHKTKLTKWLKILEDRSATLENEREELLKIETVWEKTRSSVEKGKAPEALTEQVNAILKNIRQVRKDVRESFDNILITQGQVIDLLFLINDTLERLDETLIQKQKRLFQRDQPPLWRAFADSPALKQITEKGTEIWKGNLDTFLTFVKTERSRLITHFVGIVLFILFLLALRKKSRHWKTKDEGFQISFYILSRPVSIAFLFFLAFFSTIYPQSPIFVFDFAGLLLLIPLLRILPGLVYPNMRVPLYGLAALYFFQKIYDLSVQQTLLQRLLLLIITLMALGGLIWLLRPGAAVLRQRGTRWWRAMIIAGRVALLIFAVSLMLNIIGNVALAEVLTSGMLISSYIAVVLFTIVLVLQGLLSILLQTRYALSLQMVKRHASLIKKRANTIIQVAALLVWLISTLWLFDIYHFIIGGLEAILSKKWVIGSLTLTLGDIGIFFVTLWVSYLLSRFIRFALQEDVLTRVKLPRGVSGSISLLIHYTILFIGFLIALSAAGLEWSRFALLAGALGVGIGFGLQEVVNNFISGLILIFERPIKLGDTIEFAAIRGNVIRIGIRSSTVRTFDGAEVIIPNGHLISNEVTNWTLSDRQRRVEVMVGVAYGSNPNQVLEILMRIAGEHPEILDNPEPVALFTGFGDSSLDFALRFWTNNYLNWMILSSQITLEIHNALYAAGIEIPFPQRDLHIRSVDPEISDTFKPDTQKANRRGKKKPE
jgi:small-conductance mechanosensitive channel